MIFDCWETIFNHFLGITKDEEQLKSALSVIGHRSYLYTIGAR
jgi:hypothetical protein